MTQENLIATGRHDSGAVKDYIFATPELRHVCAENHTQALALYRQQYPDDHQDYYYRGNRHFVLNERDWSSAKETVNAAERQRIGSLIADMRFAQGMSRLDLAEAANLRENTIHRIEAGRFAVTIDILSRIADALGVQITFTKKY